MTKLVGSVLLILGAVLPAVEQSREQKRSMRLTESMIQSLNDLRRMLTLRSPSMESLLSGENFSEDSETGCFFHQIQLDRLEERSFSHQWMDALQTFPISQEAKTLLEPLGTILGQCGLEEQCRCLEKTSEELEQLLRRERERFTQQQRLRLTLSLSVGMFAVILLL